MKYLLVVAHPDDEVLGAGATIHKLTSAGHSVDVCIMVSQAKARSLRPQDGELSADMESSLDMLGVGRRYMGTFPNIEMNTVPHLQLVQFIERAIMESAAEIVITHHPADTNNDHLHTSLACQAAVRLFQRRSDATPLRELWYMEVLSSTEWSLNTAINRFSPNVFVEVGEAAVAKKIDALAQYRGVMRPYPHPRSEQAIMGLAAYRSAQAGCLYAEAFECPLRRIV